MSDEERRALEREARYSKRMQSFLCCIANGHLADPRPLKAPYAEVGLAGDMGAMDNSIRACLRCGLVYATVSQELDWPTELGAL